MANMVNVVGIVRKTSRYGRQMRKAELPHGKPAVQGRRIPFV
jgi:hypothetical protein